MPLRYLWKGSPCRRSVRRPPSPRGDGSGAPVGMVAVPKTGQKTPSPRRNATEVPVGMAAVPKTGQSIGKLPFLDRSAGGSPHWDGSEVHEGRVAVPKICQKPPSPRRNASGVLVGMGAVPNPVVNPTLIPLTVPISFPSARGDGTEVPVGRGAVPKTGQKPPSPRGDGTEVPVGMVPVPKGRQDHREKTCSRPVE